jgi:RimJ/RimL family protein N-acetyltransferase
MWTPPFSRSRLNLPDQPIESERLVLRQLGPLDGEAFFDMDSDPRVAQAIPIPVAVDRPGYLAKFAVDLAAGARFRFFRALACKSDPARTIGWLFLRPTEDGANIELGYRLAHEHWGRGLMPEACCAMLNMGFDGLMLDRIVGYTLPVNRNSQRVFEKLGFDQEGTETLDGYECLAFVLNKRDWRLSKGS